MQARPAVKLPTRTRGKAAKLTLDVLEDHFHLPMAVVAKKYHVCLTYMKKVCRSHGIMKWPYRKVRILAGKSSSTTPVRLTRHVHLRMAAQGPSRLTEAAQL